MSVTCVYCEPNAWPLPDHWTAIKNEHEVYHMTDRPRGIFIQSEPWHWRWDKPHNPRICVLCWVDRLALMLPFVHIEED